MPQPRFASRARLGHEVFATLIASTVAGVVVTAPAFAVGLSVATHRDVIRPLGGPTFLVVLVAASNLALALAVVVGGEHRRVPAAIQRAALGLCALAPVFAVPVAALLTDGLTGPVALLEDPPPVPLLIGLAVLGLLRWALWNVASDLVWRLGVLARVLVYGILVCATCGGVLVVALALDAQLFADVRAWALEEMLDPRPRASE